MVVLKKQSKRCNNVQLQPLTIERNIVNMKNKNSMVMSISLGLSLGMTLGISIGAVIGSIQNNVGVGI